MMNKMHASYGNRTHLPDLIRNISRIIYDFDHESLLIPFREIICLFLSFTFLFTSLDTTRQAMAFTEVFPSIHIYIYIYTPGNFFSSPPLPPYMASRNSTCGRELWSLVLVFPFAVFASWCFRVKF
jgi:hypothetical protein